MDVLLLIVDYLLRCREEGPLSLSVELLASSVFLVITKSLSLLPQLWLCVAPCCPMVLALLLSVLLILPQRPLYQSPLGKVSYSIHFPCSPSASVWTSSFYTCGSEHCAWSQCCRSLLGNRAAFLDWTDPGWERVQQHTIMCLKQALVVLQRSQAFSIPSHYWGMQREGSVIGS